uniref:Uncharacterized protein n=2 Tax=Paracidobacterium acidisoli TaxID=2303751 RepID=A0A372IMZ1_9BACT
MTVGWLPAAAAAGQTHAPVTREQSTSDLARQIAALTGPGLVKLTIRSRSLLTADAVTAIRQLLDRDLRGFGVTPSGSDSATAVRVTLSENNTGGLWVAEVQEGTEVRVTMVSADAGAVQAIPVAAAISLRRTLLLVHNAEPVLDVLVITPAGDSSRLIVLEPERIVSYVLTAGTWVRDQEFVIGHTRPFPRDMRGRLMAGQQLGDGNLFDAYLPGVACAGQESNRRLEVVCSDSDDPWPLVESSGSGLGANTDQGLQQKAFYNETRNYFTGLLAPGFGMELPPFYEAAAIARPGGAALLFDGMDGRVQMMENRRLVPVTGANDWGSDLATVHTGCGSGAQILVSGSGAEATDSVRAYEIPGREAEPVSAPLAMEGPVTAMWPAGEGAGNEGGATVVVHAATGYEVYRVTALCN